MSLADRMTWHQGDVRIYKNLEEAKRNEKGTFIPSRPEPEPEEEKNEDERAE